MHVTILDAPVRHNIEIFLEVLRRSKQGKQPFPPQKIFDAWLQRKTGQIVFAEASKESQFLRDEWKPVQVSYVFDPKEGKIAFLIEDRQSPQKGFEKKDIAPIAYQVMLATMKMLDAISEKLKGPSDLETKMEVLAKMLIDSKVSHEGKNIIVDSWHPIDRMGAEDLLKGKPVGTYLFRRDKYTEILEKELIKRLKKPLKCFTLTFLQSHEKVSDLTVIHYDGRWQFYDDDPSLNQHAYEEINDLLALKKDLLKFPIYTQTT